jgi:hypothetical protein
MEVEPILKKTLMTVATMLGAWVAFVGTLALLAVLVTSRAVAPPEGAKDVPAAEPSPGSPPGPKGDAQHTPSNARPTANSRTHQTI